MSRICALTGHRELPKDFDENALEDALEDEILGGSDEFLCGMAAGFDLTALACLVRLKRKYPIRLVACVPFEGFDLKLPQAYRTLYHTLLPMCDEKVVLYRGYGNGCYLARDRYMVDRADRVFAYCTKEKGGTAFTVSYAKRNNIEVRAF